MARFTGGGGACCRNLAVIMHATVESNGVQSVIGYHGNLGDHAISVYQSSNPIDDEYSTDEYSLCRWTISIPSLGINHEVDIDHTVVTCLGVPEIEVTGVTLFGDCVGTISLVNYATVKLPFVSSKALEEERVSLAVDFPDGGGSPPCATLPRFVCISKKWNPGNRERPLPSWTIQWARDFEWDDEFAAYFDAERDMDVLGRWVHQPADPYAEQQLIELLWDGSEYWLDITLSDEDDTYQRVALSSCGCNFKILDVRPVSDPSPPEIPGQSISHDLLGIDLRAGKCGCWRFGCGKRRCLPKYLCGFAFIDGVLYTDLLFTWNPATKCWEFGGGDYSPAMTICLSENEQGECVLRLDYEDFDIEPVEIGNRETILNGTFAGTNGDRTRSLTLNVNTSFDGNCDQIFTCVTASPCADNCGSHPDTLHLRLRGWSTVSDTPPGPRECVTEITLKYKEVIAVSGSSVLIGCEYFGEVLVTDTVSILGVPTTQTSVITATLSLGGLKIVRRVVGNPPPTGAEAEVALTTEECNPYYGYFFTLASLRQCFFGDRNVFFHRWEAEITE